jgi:O-antigen/teichoic acid export membrane protein
MSAVASSRLAAGRSEFDNASWIVGERIVTLASTLIINIVLARALGPFAFGSLSFVLAAGMLLAPVLTFGINAIVTREWHASAETERPRIVPTTITVRAIGAAAVVAAGVSLLFMLGFPADASERVGITIFMICAITSALHVIDFIFQANAWATWWRAAGSSSCWPVRRSSWWSRPSRATSSSSPFSSRSTRCCCR